MAPAALAIPQYTNSHAAHHHKISTTSAESSSEWNMESAALDFDLLAEYLLEDVGAGGFDFSNPLTDAASPPTVSILPQDPGVVTPNGSTSFVVDPLNDVAAELARAQGGLPASGDMAGELSQVQQMMAVTTAHQTAVGAVSAAPSAPPPPSAAAAASAPNAASGSAPAARDGRGAPATIAAEAAAPGGVDSPAAHRAMAQPPNKRPRVAPAAIPPPRAKGTSYSFAAANTSFPKSAASSSACPPFGGPPGAMMGGAGGGRQKSQAQLDRRRERNRILARRTRLRKKFFFESLQKDVADLQRENAALKSIVRSRLRPDDARALLERCDANEKLPSAIHAKEIVGMSQGMPGEMTEGGGRGAKALDREDFSLIQSIQNSQQCFIITDPSLHDNPIVYASDDFLTLTGYSQEEVLGRNCRFLQGTETCQEKVVQIRKAVCAGEDVNVTFVNYTSDGKPFWNSLFIAALRDADNNIVNFIGVIVKVTGPEAGDSEYGKVLK
eukprot:CAMPEP_0181136064 /NCGR_PEP_ID=MMETSP1071-20121207/32985_1 /TAXON_ID=35127 /ORGANISM="Thalassiosira sp., Strain NH16" /LENGTH=497 /DNA_ID=CAMNT_0023222751 /DNA_START=192 /DNA_END=1686 /DNA_ORIENTATION=-